MQHTHFHGYIFMGPTNSNNNNDTVNQISAMNTHGNKKTQFSQMRAVISNTAQIKQKYVTNVVLDQREKINGVRYAKQLLIPTDVNDPSINPYSWVMRSITILFKL
jgi:hypothetical protein